MRDMEVKLGSMPVWRFACALVCTLTAAGVAVAQDYPLRPLRFIVGFPPGGGIDLAARVIAPRLAERLGQPVMIEARAGAGGSIGVDTVAKAAPDGHTIGFGVSGALTLNVTLRPSLSFDPLKDIAPVTLVAVTPLVLAAAARIPVHSVRELIAYARTRAGQLSYATAGEGTAMHLSGAMLNHLAGIELVHIPFKGNAATAASLVGGQVELAVLDLTSARAFLRAGRIRALGVTSATRTQLAAQIPTIAESGLPGFDVISWFGIIAPGGTPYDVLTRLNSELVGVLTEPESRARLMSAGLEPAPSSPEEFAALIRSEIPRLERLIRTTGLKLD